MVYSLQKAGIWKRIAAWILDGILVCILATGFVFLLSGLLGYDNYSRTLDEGYEKYEKQYGVSFDISYDDYEALSEDARRYFDTAYNALINDKDVMHAYNMVINLTMVMATVGILLSILVWEFIVPLFLQNGQSIGKKIFGICVIRSDGVRLNNLQLLTRALLGKFTVETMIPVFAVLMLYLGTGGLVSLVILLILLVGQLACLGITRSNAAIHDLMAGTVVVDMSSQMIFQTTEDLIAYQKQVAAEKAARQTY